MFEASEVNFDSTFLVWFANNKSTKNGSAVPGLVVPLPATEFSDVPGL